MPNTKLLCKDCGIPFVIEAKETRWYKKMGYKLPKRCKMCRRDRRRRRFENELKQNRK